MPRRDDDDDVDMNVSNRPLTGLDAFFANTNVVVLVLFGLCCGGIAAILGLIGVIVCTDEKAKANARLTLIIGGIMVVIGIASNIMIPMLSQR